MSQVNRLQAGGRIDRGAPLSFEFDGRALSGFRGDTLASALLANDVHLVGRSFKYHRPRGILSAGVEEPNALVQLEDGAFSEPNARATMVELYAGLRARSQNCWPSLALDLGAIADRFAPLLPAGFYYKTFMWPRSMWMRYEEAIRRMAGLGRAPALPDPDRYDHMHAHCDVLVIGAGPAGIAAALAAGRAGARVILADQQDEIGGQLLGERFEIDGSPALAWVAQARAELDAMADVRVLTRTTLTGYYDHNFLIGCQRLTDHLGPQAGSKIPRQRLWKMRAREVVIAAGSHERPIVFADNDRPGIMLAHAARCYVNRYGVRPGSRVVVVTTNDDAYRSALDLASAGATIAAIVDLRTAADGFLPERARARGIEVLCAHAIVAAEGGDRVSAVRIQALDRSHPAREIECDLVCMSGGWIPSVHLYSQSRGTLRYDSSLAAHVPNQAAQAVRCAGAANGAYMLRAALAQGYAAGAEAAQAAGFGNAVVADTAHTAEPEEAFTHVPRAYLGIGNSRRKQFVDFQNDVTVADIALAAREGYDAAELLKRYTTAGMGTDQGKTANANTAALLAELRAQAPEVVAPTTFRPPYAPLGFGAIAGANAGTLFEPVRKTPIHAWHEKNGAVFEDVGQWKRPWYYRRAGETVQAAVNRECLAARNAIGILDVSTLGKIDIQGPDAQELIERIYCNSFRALAPGRCRYGLMLRQDGMVFDDGITARLAEHHYLMSTTTAGAARVLAWLEEWLQTEWPQLKVFCTSVTEHYAQIALSGPRSLELLAPLTDVKPESMPFMSVREGQVAGIAARVFRVSFSGALGFELAVPASRGYELWTTLIGAGERFGITPYGTEAMHVLRAEKGYIIVGQETDGTVTPIDLGMERMVSSAKAFIGKRSLARTDVKRPERKQLVGLLTEDPNMVLPEGAQLVADPDAKPPARMIGHITSSYFSANCGRSIALALVTSGPVLIGETIYAALDGTLVKAKVRAPGFLDDVAGAAND